MEALAILVLGALAWIFFLPLGLWINASTAGRRIRALEEERAGLIALREEVTALRARVARLEGAKPGEEKPGRPAPQAAAVREPSPAPVSAPAAEPLPPPPPPPPTVRPAAITPPPVVVSPPVVPKPVERPEQTPPKSVPATEGVPPLLAGGPDAAGTLASAPAGTLASAPAGTSGSGAGQPDRPMGDAAGGAPPVRPPRPERPPISTMEPPEAPRNWEVVVGASWLSKLGVLILIVGLALFLGYALANMGPKGRLVVGALTSLAIFMAGRSFERRERYAVLGHALVGGGWAGLYFTTYAAHGLEASRIIESPILGAVMLAIVAAALIGDSLRYRVEAVTGLAFATGFAAMVLAPPSGFAHIAIIGFAGALLAIARRLEWRGLALFGTLAAYGTLLVRPDAVPWSNVIAALLSGKGTLIVLWLLFEVYSVTGVGRARDKQAVSAEAGVWLLNLGGYLLVTIAHSTGSTNRQRMLFFVTCAVAYVASAVLRAWRERSLDEPALDAEADAETRWAEGITRSAGSLAAALGLVTLAILQLPDGQRQTALLVEAQVVFIAGLAMRPLLLRSIAGVLFAIAVSWIVVDYLEAKTLATQPLGWQTWPHLATLAAVLLLANGEVARRRGGLVALEPAYGVVGAALVVALIEWRVQDALLGPAWLMLAIVLLATGIRGERRDLRLEAYAVGALAAGATVLHNGFAPSGQPWTLTWLPLGLCAAAFWSMGLALGRPARDDEADFPEDVLLAGTMSVWIGSGLVSVLIQRLDPDVLPAVRVAAMAAGLYESGRRLRSPFMRGAGHFLLYVALLIHLADLGATLELGHVPARIWSAAGLAGFAWLLRWRTRQGEAAEFETNSAVGLGWVPFVLVVAGVPAEVDGWRIASLWAAIALAYALYGRQMQAAGQRLRGSVLVTLAFAAAMMFATSLDDAARVVLGHGGLVVGALVVMALLAPPREEGDEGLEAWTRPGLALMATVLGGSLLASALAARWLTLAWGVHGALSLGLGFAARERVIRLAGLGWLSLCTLKLFLYDLSGLETPFRILSFVALGLLMIAASWVYARLEKVASAE